MSNNAQKKHKQRLKREKKKALVRRAMSISPYKRIGQVGDVEACYINSNWEQTGLASIQVVRRNPAGGHALACFLVDILCAGLKDAWGNIDLMQEDIKLNLDRARENVELTRIDVETARRFIASGIRFARQNGFRLPAHFDRWTNVLGGVGDVANADLNGFGKDGKLLWVGSLEDLRSRLIGCTVEQFLARPDVEYIAEASAEELSGEELFDDEEDDGEDEDDLEFENLLDACRASYFSAAATLAEKVRRFWTSRGEEIPPYVDEASLCLMLTSTTAGARENPAKYAGAQGRASLIAADELLHEKFSNSVVPADAMAPMEATIRRIGTILDELTLEDPVETQDPQASPTTGPTDAAAPTDAASGS